MSTCNHKKNIHFKNTHCTQDHYVARVKVKFLPMSDYTLFFEPCSGQTNFQTFIPGDRYPKVLIDNLFWSSICMKYMNFKWKQSSRSINSCLVVKCVVYVEPSKLFRIYKILLVATKASNTLTNMLRDSKSVDYNLKVASKTSIRHHLKNCSCQI